MTKEIKSVKSVDEKYSFMTEREHILNRPGQYVGNVHTTIQNYNLYVPSKNKILNLQNIAVNHGFIKMFDEIITNSVDERIKSDQLFRIDRVDVEVFPNGRFIVRDNGGIPVELSMKFKQLLDKQPNDMYNTPDFQPWLPIMLFGMLRTSSNYGEVREGSGLNGIGSKLTNIYSSEFKVTTCDGKNKFVGKWSENMSKFELISISKTTEHYTEFDFTVEIERFGIDVVNSPLMRVIQKRCIESAAISPGLEINFIAHETNDGVLDSSWKFKSFTEFVDLHITEEIVKQNMVLTSEPKSDIIIMPTIGYNFGLVNGSACSSGTHIRKIELAFSKHILKVLEAEGIDLITQNDILARTSIFVNAKIVNPDYDSQAKDNLSNKIPSNQLNLSKDFLAKFNKEHEIIKQLVDYYKSKYLVEKQKALRKMNRELKATKTNKLIRLNNRNPKLKHRNELFIFEGTSASNGFRAYRDQEFQSCYLLRGKIKNTFTLDENDMFKNQECRELIAACLLQLYSPKANLKDCAFGKIIFSTDADYDGYHITGLLIVFFAKWFPELFVDKRIYRLVAPIGIAYKGMGKSLEERFYYSYEEYDAGQKELAGKGWQFEYKKGLGSLSDSHYQELIENKRIERIILKENYKDTIKIWFDKSVDARKSLLMQDEIFDYEITE